MESCCGLKLTGDWNRSSNIEWVRRTMGEWKSGPVGFIETRARILQRLHCSLGRPRATPPGCVYVQRQMEGCLLALDSGSRAEWLLLHTKAQDHRCR